MAILKVRDPYEVLPRPVVAVRRKVNLHRSAFEDSEHAATRARGGQGVKSSYYNHAWRLLCTFTPHNRDNLFVSCMNATQEEGRWSKDLRDSLLQYARTKVSHDAARNDVRCASLVERGTRMACLLTACTATNERVVQSLRDSLLRSGFLNKSFLLLHTASEQIFLVNRRLFRSNVLASPTRVYHILDSNGASAPSCTTAWPEDLQSSLKAITQSLALTPTHTQHALLLECPPELAVSGVALAGWLLEYVFVYCHRCPVDMPISARWMYGSGMMEAPKLIPETVSLDSSSLSGRPLCVFSAFLHSDSPLPNDRYELMQFSIPMDLLDEVAELLRSQSQGAAAVVEHIQLHYRDRVDVSDNMRLVVHYEHRTLGHIAM